MCSPTRESQNEAALPCMQISTISGARGILVCACHSASDSACPKEAYSLKLCITNVPLCVPGHAAQRMRLLEDLHSAA